jgi:hypothetical protein
VNVLFVHPFGCFEACNYYYVSINVYGEELDHQRHKRKIVGDFYELRTFKRPAHTRRFRELCTTNDRIPNT